jgi:hypothetical protein
MAHKGLLALAAVLIVSPAIAQVMVQPIKRVPVLPPTAVVEPGNDFASKVMTIEEARARISQLLKEKREANAKLTEALATLDEMTKRGGSLVHAYCADEYTSRNTAGGEQKCERYTCNQVSGLCNQMATSSAMCASGFSWQADRCVTLEEASH